MGTNATDRRATLPDFGKGEWSPLLRLGYGLYQVLLHLLVPVFLLVLFLRARKEPLYNKHLSHRFGGMRGDQNRPVMIFAASLGETRAVSPVIRLLLRRNIPIALTHSSPAGMLEGQRLFGEAITRGDIVQGYMAVDLFWAVRRLYHRLKPRAILVVEAELWPALLAEAQRSGIPAIQVNGNYTERAFQRDNGTFGLMRARFWRFYARIITKSEECHQRYIRAGADPERTAIVGELKFDLSINKLQQEQGIKNRNALDGRQVFLIASSIEGEEEALIKVITTLRESLVKPPLILWVPRSPQRFESVAMLCREQGFETAIRSNIFDQNGAGTIPPETEVLVGNSIGEMDLYYGMADLVFVGASFFPMGGHNIIEPMAHEKPVITGPSIHGILYPALEAIEDGAMRKFETPEAMCETLLDLLENPEALAEFTAKSKGFNAQHTGAAERTLEQLKAYLA